MNVGSNGSVWGRPVAMPELTAAFIPLSPSAVTAVMSMIR